LREKRKKKGTNEGMKDGRVEDKGVRSEAQTLSYRLDGRARQSYPVDIFAILGCWRI